MNCRADCVFDQRRHTAAWLRAGCATACIAFATACTADTYTVRREGAAVVPVRETTIIMDSEDVLIERAEYSYRVTADFVLRNPSEQTVTCTMAFPVAGSTLGTGRYKDFSIERRTGSGAESSWLAVPCEIKPGTSKPREWDSFTRPTPATVDAFTEAVIWEAAWAPSETACFRVRFDMGDPKYVSGSNFLTSGAQLTYVVSTGALWAGPIGRADITLRTDAIPRDDSESGARLRRLISYPDHATWRSNEEVTWHFENWTPTEEIWLRVVSWNGLAWSDVSQAHYMLPQPYRGAETRYTEGWIDELVEQELTLAREYFPDRIAIPLETRKLHVLIADWLLHELYARHGDPFYVGRETPERGLGPGLVGDSKGNLYSNWYSQFMPYAWHGGWYKPDRPVRRSDLTATEQENSDFLVAYLKQIRAELPQEALDYQAPIHTPGIGPFPSDPAWRRGR
jgi:hypothetical protein